MKCNKGHVIYIQLIIYIGKVKGIKIQLWTPEGQNNFTTYVFIYKFRLFINVTSYISFIEFYITTPFFLFDVKLKYVVVHMS